MGFLSKLFGGKSTPDLKSLIEEGAFLVDVRSPEEFAAGHVRGSVNIPLDHVVDQLELFKNKAAIVVFCRSGNRSERAKYLLESNGIRKVANGGSWTEVNQFIK